MKKGCVSHCLCSSDRPCGACAHAQRSRRLRHIWRPGCPAVGAATTTATRRTLSICPPSPNRTCLLCCRQLKQGGFLGEPVHELYCDEVQVRRPGTSDRPHPRPTIAAVVLFVVYSCWFVGWGALVQWTSLSRRGRRDGCCAQSDGHALHERHCDEVQARRSRARPPPPPPSLRQPPALHCRVPLQAPVSGQLCRCAHCVDTSAPSAAQDFTQAELLLGLRVVADPNGMFLCGDTCQTIARGIGFR